MQDADDDSELDVPSGNGTGFSSHSKRLDN